METSLGQIAAPSLAPTIVENLDQDDTKTIAPEVSSLAQLSTLQKNVLLAIFCLGQFLDIMNTSAMLPALPATSQAVGLTESDSVWLFAAYQATFAGFLLIVSSLYSGIVGWWLTGSTERSHFRHLRSQTSIRARLLVLRGNLPRSRIPEQPHRTSCAPGSPRNWCLPHDPLCAEHDRSDAARP
jgi:hypothetical protein